MFTARFIKQFGKVKVCFIRLFKTQSRASRFNIGYFFYEVKKFRKY